MCTRSLGEFPFDLPVGSTDKVWRPLGSPTVIVGMSSLSMVLKLDRATSTAEATAGVLLSATRPNEPGDPEEGTGGYTGTSGDAKHLTYTVSGDSNFYIQPVVFGKLASGTTAGSVMGSVSVVASTTGRSVGQRTIEAQPHEDTSHPDRYILGGWMPRLGATAFRGVLIRTSVADLSWQIFARLANDPDEPLEAEGLGAGYTDFSPTSGLVEVNTTDLSVTGLTSFSSNQLIQFIVALRMKSAGANPRGFVKAIGALAY